MARGTRVFLFFAFFLLTATTAYSADSADMRKLDGEGSLLPESLSKYFLAVEKHALIFTEAFGAKCPEGAFCILPYYEIPREFRILRKSMDRCGTTRYVAEWRDKRSRARIHLADHRNRLCDDFRRYEWEMTLIERDKKPRYFGGNPKSENQDCSELGRDVACIMLYAPAVCSVSSIGASPLDEKISAEGGNSCQAAQALKKAICERGYDWQDVDDAEVTCELESPPAPAP